MFHVIILTKMCHITDPCPPLLDVSPQAVTDSQDIAFATSKDQLDRMCP